METKQKSLIDYPTKDARDYLDMIKEIAICPWCQKGDKVTEFKEDVFICERCIKTFKYKYK